MTTDKTHVERSLSVSELKSAYATLKPDGHYFDKETMSFFASKVHKAKRLENGSIVFMTSEKRCFSDDTRKRNVRHMATDGTITTLNDFCQSSDLEANRIYRGAK